MPGLVSITNQSYNPLPDALCGFRIEPIIYEMVTLDSRTRLNGFLFTMCHRSLDFFARHVKTLLMSSVEDKDSIRILSACTGVVNLACWNCGQERLIEPSAGLCRLSTHLDCISMSTFVNITHLEVVGEWPTTETLRLFPNLTHLALDDDGRIITEDDLVVLSGLSSSSCLLKIIIVLVQDPNLEPYIPVDHDNPGLVLLKQPTNLQSFVSDWEAHVRGGADMWVRAEEVAESRVCINRK